MSHSCDPVDCSLPGSSVHGILQARILEWVAISFSRGSSRPGDQTQVSCIAGGFFSSWAIREALTFSINNSIKFKNVYVHIVLKQCCFWVAKSSSTLCDPMDCSMPGFPVPSHFPEFAQVHVHWIGDAIQLSHPLSLSSPSAFNLSQHHCLFQLVSCLHQVGKYWSFGISHFSEYSGLIYFTIDWFDIFTSQGTLKSSLAPQFKSMNSSVLCLLHGSAHTLIQDYQKGHSLDYMDLCWQSDVFAF